MPVRPPAAPPAPDHRSRRRRSIGRAGPRALLAAVVLLVGVAGPAAAETRRALVIGNAAYPEAELRNPFNDARAIAAALGRLGFAVALHADADKAAMEDAIGAFGRALDPDTVALVYYSGHGVQLDGRNYLLPVDARISAPGDVRLEAIDADLVLDQMARGRSRLNILILDACRNNPFERRFRSGGGGGLAPMTAPSGTLIAYATAPGAVASDGEGRHGLYTGALLGALATPDLAVETMFKRARSEVMRRSDGLQVPWEASSLTGEFVFNPATGVGETGPAAAAPAVAAAPPAADAMAAAAAAVGIAAARPVPDRVGGAAAPVAAAPAAPAGSAVPAPPAFPSLDPDRVLPARLRERLHNADVTPRRLVQAARRGHAAAQALLGRAFEVGRGVPRDLGKAVRWYRAAAISGHPLGQVGLGNLLRTGRGVARDPAAAAAWYRRAAAQGHPLGQLALAFAHRDGTGVRRDPAEAVRLFQAAARRGLAIADAALGWHYEHGVGVAVDRTAARRSYRRAAAQGNAYAAERLGRMGP